MGESKHSRKRERTSSMGAVVGVEGARAAAEAVLVGVAGASMDAGSIALVSRAATAPAAVAASTAPTEPDPDDGGFVVVEAFSSLAVSLAPAATDDVGFSLTLFSAFPLAAAWAAALVEAEDALEATPAFDPPVAVAFLRSSYPASLLGRQPKNARRENFRFFLGLTAWRVVAAAAGAVAVGLLALTEPAAGVVVDVGAAGVC